MSKGITRRELLRLIGVGSAMGLVAACEPKVVEKVVKETVIVAGTPKVVEKVVKETVVVEKGAPAAAPKEKVKIRYQSRSGGGAAGENLWTAFFEYFYAKNPNIEVDWLIRPGDDTTTNEAIMSQMVAGDGPDVYQLCCAHSAFFIQQGQALNLQPYIDRDAEEVDMDDFHDHEFDAWKLNGDIYMMPYYSGSVAIFYNKDMFDEAGVEYPATKWGDFTFEKYRELANKFVVREKPLKWGTSNYGHGANWITQYWLRGFGAHMVDPDDHEVSGLCEPEALECLEAARQMIHEEHSFAQGAELGGVGVVQLFNNGSLAMMENGSWAIQNCVAGASWSPTEGTEWLDFAWDVAPLWNGRGGPTTFFGMNGQSVWTKTPHPEEAWQLCKEISSPTFQKLNISIGEGLQPSRKSVLPYFVDWMRKKWPILEQVHVELFAECMYENIGRPEEMFINDRAAKDQILKPAFDQVLLENKAPVDLICEHSKVIAKFNKGEIGVEEIGGELAKIKV